MGWEGLLRRMMASPCHCHLRMGRSEGMGSRRGRRKGRRRGKLPKKLCWRGSYWH